MKLIIQCFGIASEICAKDALGGYEVTSVEASIKQGSSIADLDAWLREKYPELNELRHFFIARNQRQAAPEEIIEAGDELVIIPPVAGG